MTVNKQKDKRETKDKNRVKYQHKHGIKWFKSKNSFWIINITKSELLKVTITNFLFNSMVNRIELTTSVNKINHI